MTHKIREVYEIDGNSYKLVFSKSCKMCHARLDKGLCEKLPDCLEIQGHYEIVDTFDTSKLSLKEIENLVKTHHYEEGHINSRYSREERIEATRNKIGYTKEDVKKYLK